MSKLSKILYLFIIVICLVAMSNMGIVYAKIFNPADTSGPATPAGSDTQVQFNDGGVLAGDSGLVFDKATNILSVDGGIGIGTLTPTYKLEAIASSTGLNGLKVQNTSSNSSLIVGSVVSIMNDLDYEAIIGMTNSGSTILAGAFVNTLQNYNPGYGDSLYSIAGAYDHVFYSDPTDSHDYVTTMSNELMRLTTDGYLGIGTSSPSFILDVNGNSRIEGTLKVGAYTLPAIDGNNGYILKTDGTGALSWQEDSTTGGQVILYYDQTVSDIGGYEILSTEPDQGAEVSETAVSTSGSYGLIDPYIASSTDIIITDLRAGNWRFHEWSKVDSAVGNTHIVHNIYKRASGGTETLLFQATSTPLSTIIVEDLYTYTFDAETLLETDRLVIKNYCWTDTGVEKTCTFYYGGSERYSHVTTPLVNSDLGYARTAIDETITGDWDIEGDLEVDNINIDGYARICSSEITDGATITIDWDACNKAYVVLGGNRTVALDNLDSTKVGGSITLYLTQDGTGTRLLPTFPASVNWGSAGAPTLDTGAGITNIISLSIATSSATIHARYAN